MGNLIKRLLEQRDGPRDISVDGEANSPVLYHGTIGTQNFRSIIKHGLQGQEKQGRSSLAPIKNRVYTTHDIVYAMIYALGGVVMGRKISDRALERGRYGYVFEIIPPENIQAMPDEDIVGEIVTLALGYEKYYREYIHSNNTEWKKYKTLLDDDHFRKSMIVLTTRNATSNQLRGLRTGFMDQQARVGKKLLKIMPDWMKQKILSVEGTHRSYEGPLLPIRAWRIDRRLSPKLARDGSNFFDLAKLVWENRRLDERAFHGSSEANPRFEPRHRGTNSTVFGTYHTDRTGIFFSSNSEFAALYGNVQEYELSVSFTLDLNDRNIVYDFIEGDLKLFGDDRGLWIDARNVLHGTWPVWHMFEGELGERFVQWLMSKGYDSARYQEYNEDDDGVEHESETFVVFDPKKVTRVS